MSNNNKINSDNIYHYEYNLDLNYGTIINLLEYIDDIYINNIDDIYYKDKDYGIKFNMDINDDNRLKVTIIIIKNNNCFYNQKIILSCLLYILEDALLNIDYLNNQSKLKLICNLFNYYSNSNYISSKLIKNHLNKENNHYMINHINKI